MFIPQMEIGEMKYEEEDDLYSKSLKVTFSGDDDQVVKTARAAVKQV